MSSVQKENQEKTVEIINRKRNLKMEIITDGIKRIDCSGETLFLPYYNLWNRNVYRTSQAFRHSPTMIRANSTSGSPVILGRKFFAGFLNPHADAEFAFDETTLTCTVPPGQSLYYDEGDPYAIWHEYNQLVTKTFSDKNPAVITSLPEIEYCTWVEQKRSALCRYGSHGLNESVAVLDDNFIDDYLHRLDRMSLPRGVFTLDHGWSAGSTTFNFGTVTPDVTKFRNFAATIRRIQNAGFIPGLWFAPAFNYPDNPIFRQHPGMCGERFSGANEGGFQFPVHYFNTIDSYRDTIIDWFRQIFTPYLEMGIKKLKIDFTYNNKSKMIKILELIYTAVKSIRCDVEVEGHIPDIFASRFQDAVRLNDIVMGTASDWSELFESHYEVCSNSAWKTQLNLDHIGTNSPDISETDFLKSLSLFRGKTGYPVVSLLPDHFSSSTIAFFSNYLKEYDEIKNELTAAF
jgi:hypothetical protein